MPPVTLRHSGGMARLLEIMQQLRDPQTGCPWDRQQDFRSIAPYTLEEAYEVADAIERDAHGELCQELGDLLFQVVYHAQMAAEQGWFDFHDVVDAINDKLVRRHPHVFGDEEIGSAEEQSHAWEQHKAAERQARQQQESGLLDDVPVNLPALVRAAKLQGRAARVGFDWPDADGVSDKLLEECSELQAARASGVEETMAEEMGDVLFTCVNLARHLGLDAETTLRLSNEKFRRRFQWMERQAGEQGLQHSDDAALDALWQQAKLALAPQR